MFGLRPVYITSLPFLPVFLFLVAGGTLKDWFRKYELNGIEGFEPKKRVDWVQSRRMSVKLSEALLAIIHDYLELSVRQIIASG